MGGSAMSQQQNEVYLAELGHWMPKNKLNIIACIAENGSMNKWQISKRSSVALTVIRHHVNKLLAEGYIRQISEKEYKRRGRERAYRVTVKGLIVAIIYKTSPIYHEPEYKEIAIDGTDKILRIPDYRRYKELVDPPDLFPHYLETLDVMLEKNQRLLGIKYKTMLGKVQEIARMSIIMACYSIYRDYRDYLRQKRCTRRSILGRRVPILVYDKEFISRFLFQPELTKIDGWERWFDTLTEDPKLKRRCLEYMKARKSRLERDEAEISRTLTAIDEIGARYAL
jgi:hypothetical protein